MISSLVVWLTVITAVFAKKKIGPLAHDHVIDFIVGLPLNNVAELEQSILDMHDPSSDKYGKYGTPETFQANYGPTPDQIQQITAFLEAHSLTVNDRSPTPNMITASGKVSNVNSAFKVDLQMFLDDDEITYYFDSEAEANLPEGAICLVGLENRTRFSRVGKHRNLIPTDAPDKKKAKKVKSKRKKFPLYRYTVVDPYAIRTSYTIGDSYNGTGQVGAVYELAGFYPSDVTEYENYFGLPNVPLSIVCLDGVGCPAIGDGDGYVEVTVDIDLMVATAPGLSEIIVYEAPNTLYNGCLLYAQIASENRASVISISWAIAEDEGTMSYFELESAAFMNMAHNGQSVFAASGDFGAFANGKRVGVSDPASQAYVTGVGGTELFVTSTGAYNKETTWWSGSVKNGGGGGGVSSYVPIPSYQQTAGIITAANHGSKTHRNVPDVSLNAEDTNGYYIYLTDYQGVTGWFTLGGTSCATPIWAGFALAINQKLVREGKPVLGNFNLKLYPLATSSSYDTYFHDIDNDSTNGYKYKAVKGYDLCTGWGSMKGDALLSAF